MHLHTPQPPFLPGLTWRVVCCRCSTKTVRPQLWGKTATCCCTLHAGGFYWSSREGLADLRVMWQGVRGSAVWDARSPCALTTLCCCFLHSAARIFLFHNFLTPGMRCLALHRGCVLPVRGGQGPSGCLRPRRAASPAASLCCAALRRSCKCHTHLLTFFSCLCCPLSRPGRGVRPHSEQGGAAPAAQRGGEDRDGRHRGERHPHLPRHVLRPGGGRGHPECARGAGFRGGGGVRVRG